MNGIGGKAAWAWIFILEGLATVICAIASFWIIEDFPQTAKFLSEPEREHYTDYICKMRFSQDDMLVQVLW